MTVQATIPQNNAIPAIPANGFYNGFSFEELAKDFETMDQLNGAVSAKKYAYPYNGNTETETTAFENFVKSFKTKYGVDKDARAFQDLRVLYHTEKTRRSETFENQFKQIDDSSGVAVRITKQLHDKMHGILPPIYLKTGFAMSEVAEYNAKGEPLYYCFAQICGCYFATRATLENARYIFGEQRAFENSELLKNYVFARFNKTLQLPGNLFITRIYLNSGEREAALVEEYLNDFVEFELNKDENETGGIVTQIQKRRDAIAKLEPLLTGVKGSFVQIGTVKYL